MSDYESPVLERVVRSDLWPVCSELVWHNIGETDYYGLQTDEPLRIAWAPFAHPDAPSGYGVIARKMREGFQELQATGNVHVLNPTAFGWDVAVAISLPAAWAVTADGRSDLVWHTMFEMEPLPPGWADVLNKCAAVWVPSAWCKDLFERNGVHVPIFVVGYGVDHSIFWPKGNQEGRAGVEGRAGTGARPYRVLVWAQGLVGRKNPLMALRAFQQCDFAPDEAEIEIKVNANYGQEDIKGPNGGILPNARVIAADWPASRVADWLRSGDVLVYLSGGEGFGLMPLEAMACGVPVICAANTGMMEYLTPDNAMLVGSVGQEKNVGYTLMHGKGTDFYCQRPDQDEAADWLRWAFTHRDEAAEIGRRGAETARQWTWRRTAERALAELNKLFDAREGRHSSEVEHGS